MSKNHSKFHSAITLQTLHWEKKATIKQVNNNNNKKKNSSHKLSRVDQFPILKTNKSRPVISVSVKKRMLNSPANRVWNKQKTKGLHYITEKEEKEKKNAPVWDQLWPLAARESPSFVCQKPVQVFIERATKMVAIQTHTHTHTHNTVADPLLAFFSYFFRLFLQLLVGGRAIGAQL